MIALQDPDGAAAEVLRIHDDLGFRAVFTRPNPIGGRNLDDPAYEPVWKALSERQMTLGLHEGGMPPLPQAGSDRLTNAEDDARADATERDEATSDELPAEHVAAHVGDVDPLQAIEDALRMFPADEIVDLTAPNEEATWLEAGLGEKARERFSAPVTHLVTR